MIRSLYGFDKEMRFDRASKLARYGVRILDVGGGRGDFFDFSGLSGVVAEVPHDRSLFQRVVPTHPYVVFDGENLPFKSKTFDTVVCLDTLEHVPPAKRKTFLREIQRVSGDQIILTFPERHLFLPLLLAIASFLELTGLSPAMRRSLKEHMQYGLPSRDDVFSAIERKGWIVQEAAFFGQWAVVIWILQFFLPFLATAPFNRGLARFVSRIPEGSATERLFFIRRE